MSQERIKLEMTVKEAIVAMADGNPGAISVMAGILKEGPIIDPDCESFFHILGLDSLGIYGSQIWVLFKDLCEQSYLNLLTVLRANQCGILDEGLFHESMKRGCFPMAFGTLRKQVQEVLPNFGQSASIDNSNQM